MNILQLSITASFLMIAVMVLRAVFINRIPHRIFNFLWLICIVKLVIPFEISSRFSIFNYVGNTDSGGSIVNHNPVPVNPIPTTNVPVQNVENAIINNPLYPVMEQVTPINYMAVIWIIGFIVLLGFFSFSYIKNIKKLSCSLPNNDIDISNIIDKYSFKRKVEIRQSDLIISPLTYGIFKPVIALPKAMNLDNSEQLEHALLHELIHIKRFDALQKLLLMFILCLHWFNPIVWMMVILANRDIEMACDEGVLNILGIDKRSKYALSLIKFEENKIALNPMCMFNKNISKDRIKKIMKHKKAKIVTVLVAVALIVGVVAACGTDKTEKQDFGETRSNSQLTFEKLIQLSKKGEDLTWSDFDDYAYEEGGGGLYIRFYETAEGGRFVIGGTPNDKPWYFRYNGFNIFDYDEYFLRNTIPVKPVVINEEQFSNGFVDADGFIPDYVSDEIIIFHASRGLFVYDIEQRRIIQSLDLIDIDCTATQGDNYCDVSVSKDGNIIYLNPLDTDEMYVYNRNGTLYKTKYEPMQDRFDASIFYEKEYPITYNGEGEGLEEVMFHFKGKSYQLFRKYFKKQNNSSTPIDTDDEVKEVEEHNEEREFYILTDDNAPIGTEFSRGQDISDVKLVNWLISNTSPLLMPKPQNVKLSLITDDVPQKVNAYLWENNQRTEWEIDSETYIMPVPKETGSYIFILEITWHEKDVEKIAFSVDVQNSVN